MTNALFFASSSQPCDAGDDKIKNILNDESKSDFIKAKLIDDLFDHPLGLQSLYSSLKQWAVELTVIEELAGCELEVENIIAATKHLVEICYHSLELRHQLREALEISERPLAEQHLLFACKKVSGFIENMQNPSMPAMAGA